MVNHLAQGRASVGDEHLDVDMVRQKVMQLISAAVDGEEEDLVCDVDGLGCGRQLLPKPTGLSYGYPFVKTYDKEIHAGNSMVCFS